MSIPFKQVDVFTQVPFRGNPVAVVLDAEGLSTEQMQRIANWTNLSETTFVLPPTRPGADYRVRIFTPKTELPFAGHPTIGTAHALLEAGAEIATDDALVQECAAGLIRLEVTPQPDGEPWIAFELPPPQITPLTDDERPLLESILGTSLSAQPAPRLIDVGARWIVAQLPNAAAVLALRPDLPRLCDLSVQARVAGVTIFGEHEAGAAARIEVRSFAPAHGIDEDPVCGNGNGCVAAFVRETGQVERLGRSLLSSQGAALGRSGTVRLVIDEQRILVGGMAVTCVDGWLASSHEPPGAAAAAA